MSQSDKLTESWIKAKKLKTLPWYAMSNYPPEGFLLFLLHQNIFHFHPIAKLPKFDILALMKWLISGGGGRKSYAWRGCLRYELAHILSFRQTSSEAFLKFRVPLTATALGVRYCEQVCWVIFFVINKLEQITRDNFYSKRETALDTRSDQLIFIARRKWKRCDI